MSVFTTIPPVNILTQCKMLGRQADLQPMELALLTSCHIVQHKQRHPIGKLPDSRTSLQKAPPLPDLHPKKISVPLRSPAALHQTTVPTLLSSRMISTTACRLKPNPCQLPLSLTARITGRMCQHRAGLGTMATHI